MAPVHELVRQLIGSNIAAKTKFVILQKRNRFDFKREFEGLAAGMSKLLIREPAEEDEGEEAPTRRLALTLQQWQFDPSWKAFSH